MGRSFVAAGRAESGVSGDSTAQGGAAGQAEFGRSCQTTRSRPARLPT